VCAENRVRAIVGRPSAQRWLDVNPGVSANYLGFFYERPLENMEILTKDLNLELLN
jgi:hypothetical protein